MAHAAEVHGVIRAGEPRVDVPAYRAALAKAEHELLNAQIRYVTAAEALRQAMQAQGERS